MVLQKKSTSNIKKKLSSRELAGDSLYNLLVSGIKVHTKLWCYCWHLPAWNFYFLSFFSFHLQYVFFFFHLMLFFSFSQFALSSFNFSSHNFSLSNVVFVYKLFVLSLFAHSNIWRAMLWDGEKIKIGKMENCWYNLSFD